nr:lasso peptide biosynthesis protein [Hyphomicrobium sulfonivorans]
MAPVWLEWHQARGGQPPTVASRHTCGRTSLFMVEVLRHRGLPATWMSGTPRLDEAGPELGPFGFFDGSRWQAHAWVMCGGMIVDITADQFGADDVIVTLQNDPRYRAGARNTPAGDTALPQFVAARRIAVDAIWPRWLSYCASGPGPSV